MKKTLPYLIGVFTITLLIFCSTKNAVASKKNAKNWVSVQYIDCLRKSCPCECLNKDDVSVILFDTITRSTNVFVYTNNLDYDLWDLKSLGENKFDAYRNSKTKVGSLSLNGDTLFLKRGTKTEAFVNYPEFESYKGEEYIGKLNAFIVNNSFGSNDSLLHQVLTRDSIVLHCNQELNVNLVSTQKNCQNSWVLSQRDDKVWLYRFLNSCEGKSIHPKIDTSLIGCFKR